MSSKEAQNMSDVAQFLVKELSQPLSKVCPDREARGNNSSSSRCTEVVIFIDIRLCYFVPKRCDLDTCLTFSEKCMHWKQDILARDS